MEKITHTQISKIKTKFFSEKKKIERKRDREIKVLAKPYLKLVAKYVKDNTDLKRNKVYELATPNPRKRYHRIVAYVIEAYFFGGQPSIRLGGWWLDQNNVPVKWDTLLVGGLVNNPTKLVLSKNQVHKPHPESNPRKGLM